MQIDLNVLNFDFYGLKPWEMGIYIAETLSVSIGMLYGCQCDAIRTIGLEVSMETFYFHAIIPWTQSLQCLSIGRPSSMHISRTQGKNLHLLQ